MQFRILRRLAGGIRTVARQTAPATGSNAAAAPLSEKCICSDPFAALDIDRVTPLRGTMAAYNRHVLVSTGKSDWKSKIEFDDGLAAHIKGILGKTGLSKGFDELRDPDNIVLTTNSSYPPSPSPPASGCHSSAYIFPQNLYLPMIPIMASGNTASKEVAEFISAYLLPSSPRPSLLYRAPSLPLPPRKVQETHILVCTHNSRDRRCGIIGPILHEKFRECLSAQGLLHPKDPDVSIRGRVRIGNISHIGGHRYAGNVIIYLPPNEENWDGGGKGIWYGRVGEADVEKIVAETILKGEVIEGLFRGGIGL